jgi:hypothetical protein
MIWVMVIVIYMVGITFGTFGTFSSFALAFIALGALATFALTFAALGALSSFSLACTIFDIMIIVNYNSNLAVVWRAQSTCSMMVMVVIVGNVHITSFAALGALTTFALTFAALGALATFALALVTLATFALSSWINVNITE